MENNFLKINKTCLQNIVDINSALENVETKGESTMLMYKIREVLSSTLKEIVEDNKPKEE